MLYQYIRVIKAVGATLTDLSLRNQEEGQSLPFALTTGTDKIYIGQHYPTNNFFIQSSVANDVAANINIEFWDAKDWRSAVDILDGTANTSGVPLSKSGIIQFTPDPQYRWAITNDTKNGQFPTELSTLNIYNMYWMRFSYSATLKVGTTIKRVAYAFTRHQQIDNYDRKINQYLDSFEVGKTSWDDEIITASIMVIRDLKRRGLVVSPGQVLRFDDVSMPTDWKTLELIYRNLGGDYKDKLAEAKDQYEKSIVLERYSFDKDENAFLSGGEINNTVGKLVR